MISSVSSEFLHMDKVKKNGVSKQLNFNCQCNNKQFKGFEQVLYGI